MEEMHRARNGGVVRAFHALSRGVCQHFDMLSIRKPIVQVFCGGFSRRRDKKAFLSEQCKEIEENIRIGKTRDLSKNIRDTKGTYHTKMGIIKDRDGMDLTEKD